jgi:hypothetical protein
VTGGHRFRRASRVARASRAAATVVVVTVVALASATLPGGAQAAADDERSRTVTVDVAGKVDTTGDEGALVRTDSSTPAPILSLYVGLSAVGAVLGVAISRGRRHRPAGSERSTGLVAWRRRTDFWDLPAAAGSVRGPGGRGRRLPPGS